MQPLNRWEILEGAPPADEAVWTKQFTNFVNSFVQKERRERWLHLLLNRPKQVYSNSHKLHQHLDRTKCSQLEDTGQLNSKSKGVYYDFSNEPLMLTVADALIAGPENDGIFSLVPGKSAIYFFHEGNHLLCKE